MMVPAKWGPLLESPLFSWQARLAYLREPKRAEELKASAPAHDESVADFVRRHFGEEVTATIAGPLLAAVFGGDIAQLSVRAVMPAFVRMEAEEGSLIQAVQRRAQNRLRPSSPPLPVASRRWSTAWFPGCRQHLIRLRQPVLRIEADHGGWRITTAERLAIILTRWSSLLRLTLPAPCCSRSTNWAPGWPILLPQQATSAIVVALAFAAEQAAAPAHPPWFWLCGSSGSRAKAGRVPVAGLHLRGSKVSWSRPARGGVAAGLLRRPRPAMRCLAKRTISSSSAPVRNWAASWAHCRKPSETLVRRWPQSLPQYSVGHLDRMAELESHACRTCPVFTLWAAPTMGWDCPISSVQGRSAARSRLARAHRCRKLTQILTQVR